jgi:hypothetical protein
MYDFQKFKVNIKNYYKNIILIYDHFKKNIMILKIIEKIFLIVVEWMSNIHKNHLFL